MGKRTRRKIDPMHVIRAKIAARMLPAEPPADLMPQYKAAVKRLMNGDTSANVEIQKLRAEEFKRQRGGGR